MRISHTVFSARWGEARALFEQALERPEPEQLAWIERRCGADAELHAAARALYDEDRAATDRAFLPLPDVGARATALDGLELCDVELGGFRLLRRIGSGGMGVVYEAEQRQPRRRVAIKVLQPGLASGVALRRFQAEIDVLARLQHPGIAQVFASGVDALSSGPLRVELVWYAMELLEDARDLRSFARDSARTVQRTSTEDAPREHTADARAVVETPAQSRAPCERTARDAHALDERGVLRLFLALASAVAHAHQRGVIHRDLKPQNVLVTRAGHPKVIDFGIAHVREHGPDGGDARTSSGEVLGTLSTMAPEQLDANAEPVDVRADVYALGVMLYELLVDRAPIELAGLSLLDAARAVREQAPRRPRSLAPRLAPELEWILLKCLEKERERRYASVAALADDIERHLRGESVQAGAPSRAYRAKKALQRHKLAYAMTALAFVALVGGLVATSLALRDARIARGDADAKAAEARSELERKVQLADVFDYTVGLAYRKKPDADLLFRDVLAELEQTIERGHYMQPDGQLSLRAVLMGLYRATGDDAHAFELGERALADAERNGLASSLDGALLEARMADLYAFRGDMARANECSSKARAAEANLGELRWGDRIFLGYSEAGQLMERGDTRGALRLLRELERCTLWAERPDDEMNCIVSGSIAQAELELGELDDALARARDVVARHTAIHGPDHPHVYNDQVQLAAALVRAGSAQEGREHARLAADGFARQPTRDRVRELRARNVEALALRALGCTEEALEMQLEVLADRAQFLGPAHRHTIGSYVEVASLLCALGRYDEALARAREGCAWLQRTQFADHPMGACLRGIAAHARAELGEAGADAASEAREEMRGETRDEMRAAYDALERAMGADAPRVRELRQWLSALESP